MYLFQISIQSGWSNHLSEERTLKQQVHWEVNVVEARSGESTTSDHQLKERKAGFEERDRGEALQSCESCNFVTQTINGQDIESDYAILRQLIESVSPWLLVEARGITKHEASRTKQ